MEIKFILDWSLIFCYLKHFIKVVPAQAHMSNCKEEPRMDAEVPPRYPRARLLSLKSFLFSELLKDFFPSWYYAYTRLPIS